MYIWILFLGTRCQLISTAVSSNWHPGRRDKHWPELVSHDCYSTWYKRNDISGQAKVSGSPALDGVHRLSRANDGFYCKNAEGFAYQSRSIVNEDAWLQLDFNTSFTLQCLRLSLKSVEFLNDLLFRFGNKSKDEDFTQNPVILYKKNVDTRTNFEYCLDRDLAGRYLLLHRKPSDENVIHIGDIQVLIN